jgi:pimeloyl-ACP methyl ester carboxylesterase
MLNFQTKALALSAATLLASCGGGSESTSISGLAATGAAMAEASLVAKCASGAPITSTTDANGAFSLVLNGGQTLPCLVKVTKGAVTLHSFATTAGRLNVTPLTDMVVSRALGGNPTSAFDAYDASKGDQIRIGLDAAKTYARAQVTLVAGSAPAGDLMTGTFKVGDADDRVLDALKVALTAAGKTLTDLRLGAAIGGSIAASLDRGKLIGSAITVTTLTAANINSATASSGLQGISGPAVCDVKVVSLNYKTIGVAGEATNASGVMLVPGGACTTPAGLVAYAKGTDVQKLRTLANPADGETFLLIAMYAAKGYAVVATDYLGFAQSAYTYHPYLHADSEASSIIDSIRAARNAASAVSASLSGNVMLTGYSQGGHASMAAHRAIERDNSTEINVIAGAHLAGPYNLSGSFQLTDAIAGYQFFVPYLVTAWQKVYGNIYSDVNAVFKAPYAAGITNLLPNATLNYTTLITTGALPYGPLPNQARDQLFTPEFITASRSTTGPLFLAGKKNDLLGWNPKSKVLLCGGSGDPTVPPAVHQAVMKADFDSRSLTNVTSVNVDASVQAVYGAVLAADPATYYGNYHGTYEPPFCHANGRGLFDMVTASLP